MKRNEIFLFFLFLLIFFWCWPHYCRFRLQLNAFCCIVADDAENAQVVAAVVAVVSAAVVGAVAVI